MPKATPNHSLNATPSGGAARAGLWSFVHFYSPARAARPLWSSWRERQAAQSGRRLHSRVALRSQSLMKLSENNMSTAANVVIGLVGLLHIYILVLEMFLWDKPRGMKAFGLTPESAAATKVLAANQGLYNGFLAAGLLWGLYLGPTGNNVKAFFLLCVLIAGLYGAATANKRILFIQAVPAAVGLLLLYLS